MSYGTLYGVGVGPGAPDLMTLRAIHVLKSADVLAIPRSNDFGASTAWRIAEPHVGEIAGQERLYLTFPMSMDPARVAPAWDKALAEIGKRLEAGRSLAFMSEGDPMVYSTFVYLLREAPRRWPGIRIEIVPAVTSITAVPAAIGVPLGDGQERVAIIPAAYGVEDLEALLETFDTVVLMKIGSNMAPVVELLERKGLLDKAVYVSRATMPEEKVVRDVRAIRASRGDCFSMLVIAQRGRSGVLLGDVPRRAPVAPLQPKEARP